MKSCRKLKTKQDEQRIRSKDELKTMKKGCRKKRTLKKNYFNIKFFVCLHGDKIYNSEH
jgi:hypothetical protein